MNVYAVRFNDTTSDENRHGWSGPWRAQTPYGAVRAMLRDCGITDKPNMGAWQVVPWGQQEVRGE